MKARTTLCMTFAAVGLIVVPCLGQDKNKLPVEVRRERAKQRHEELLIQRDRILNEELVRMAVAEFVPIGLKKDVDRVEATADRYRQRLNRFMALRVDEVKRVCKPTAAQLKKIEVAAKGAVEQMMQKWRSRAAQVKARPLAQMRGRVLLFHDGVGDAIPKVVDGILLPPAPVQLAPAQQLPAAKLAAPAAGPGGAVLVPKAGPAPVAAVAGEHPPEIPVAAPPNFNLAMPAMQRTANAALDVASVERELVWRKSLQRVLTDEQKATYRRAALERRDRNGDSAGDCVIEMLDHQLLLSGSQREQLGSLIEQRLGKRRLEMILSVNQQADVKAARADAAAMQNAYGRVLTYVTQRIPSSLVEDKILTASQVAWWNELRTGRGPILVPAKDDATRVFIEYLEDTPPSP